MPGILGDIPGFGRIYECWDCPNIHLQVGPVNISFARDAYMQLVDLVNTSAANFELLRHGDQMTGPGPSNPQERTDSNSASRRAQPG